MSETFKSALAADNSEFDKFPQSYGQERLWFLDQLEPNSPAYIIPAALRISGLLDRAALDATFNHIVNRHESLRTTFCISDSRPVQLIAPSRPHLLDFLDLSHLDENEGLRRAKAIATEEAHSPFDLSRGPLLRTKLLKLADLDHVLIVTMHHIISDGWSIGVFIREIGAIYSALVNGQQYRLEQLQIQYADYAAWQREWLEGEQIERQLRYWRKQLGGEIRNLELPTDRVRPARQSFRGGREYARVRQEVTRKLREMSRREGVTEYILLLAAYKVMLMRVSGEEEVCVGTPIAGRNRRELEGLIGFFVNTLVMKTDLSGNPTFRQLLKRVKKVAVEAYAHQDLPFEKLVEELQPERDLSRSPLFQVTFALQGNLLPSIELPGVTIAPLDIIKETAKFDLNFSVSDTDEGFLAGLVYKSDLFEPATITRMLQHFNNLLEGIVANPDERIWDLPLLTSAERRQLIVDWNDTRTYIPNDYCIHELFEAQAEATPYALALAFNDERITYRALNLRANQLAHHLKDLGVGPEVCVGLYMERSVEMVVGLLGILKAGAAYVPIDPAYPAKRVRFMLDDIKAPVLLTQKRLANQLPLNEAQLICLDSDWELIARSGDHNPASRVTSQNLAYIIYTSGSTGQPKGVMVEHRSVCNLAEAQIRAFDVQPTSQVLQFAAISFDASVSEIFTTLLKGATLWLSTQERLLPGSDLIELLHEGAITTVTFPPTVLATLPDEQLLHLQTIVAAGETCSSDIVRRWAKGRRFLNAYGPTETTVCATIAEVVDGSRRPPIGRPIANAQVYVLDRGQQPVPVGVIGEIYVGGAGVARGYMNSAELTAERFMPDPFSAEPGARLYRTGDLARYLSNQNIEYVGRLDHQVKIRGYRIELAEIEEALRQHSEVEDAVVLARKDAHDESRLAAYVVARQQPAPTINDLREFLSERLPEYMVPPAFVLLPELPLTPNGKIDRRALLALELGRPERDKPYQAPRTELEILLAKIWQDILSIENISIYDNFFDLGGDSIRGAIFINELQDMLGEVVYVVALFDAPTIAEFAGYLAQRYPVAVSKVCGTQVSPDSEDVSQRIDEIKVAHVRSLIETSRAPEKSGQQASAKNSPAIFVLSPPRSGSTLLRVMLGGNPSLFAPPELELLGFTTLKERRRELTGRYGFWLEGTIRAVMQIKGCGLEEARKVVEQSEDDGLTTQEFYAQMQGWLEGKTLVDKTPSYALDIATLKRAENYFDNALYIHLLRHPCGMIKSFEDAKLEQVFFRYKHDYTSREIAEIIWVISQQNILNFLGEIPRQRQISVRFEDLVTEPEKTLAGLCEFLGIELHENMMRPYDDKKSRMTDGIHPLSKMLGDIKFHEHKQVDAGVAETWRQTLSEDKLGEITREIALTLGYRRAKEWTTIRRIPRDEYTKLPVSFAQQRLWFLDQLEPGNSSYNIPSALWLSGNLNVGAIEKSFREVVRRHEALRTTFEVVEGQPMQVIAPELIFTVPVIDLTEMREQEKQNEWRLIAHEEANRPFDLERGPLLRVNLIRLDETTHIALLTMHHIVSDGWSMGVLIHELATLYEAYAHNADNTLAELEIQYADFADWQREWLRGEILDKQVEYWKQQLGGSLPVLELPADRPRPATQSFRGRGEKFVLNKSLSQNLKALSNREGVTLFMTLVTAFKTLLCRYSGQDDVLIGTPIANRNRAELEKLIGFFVNTLVLRTDLSGDPSFQQLLKRVRDITLAAYAHQDLPFEKLVEELNPERDRSRAPLFQVMFILQNAPMPTEGLSGLTLSPVQPEVEAAKFDLTLSITETEEGLRGSLNYSADLFTPGTIRRMIAHFQNLLEAVAVDPQQRISELPLLSEAELEELTDSYNDTGRDYGEDKTICQLFEAQVEATPDAVAVVFKGESLNYRELNSRANKLSHHLLSLGIEPEDRVGICVNRSLDMVVGLLGILKSGGAYVPLDPTYPPERLSFMLEDAQASVLLTQEELLDDLPGQRANAVCLDRDWPIIAQENEQNPTRNLAARNLAYVIYTSGSTGQPKGVLCQHSSAVNRFNWMWERYPFESGEVCCQKTSLSFVDSVWEVFGPLLKGITTVIIDNDDVKDPERLIQVLAENKVTRIVLVPSLLRAILESRADLQSTLPSLRYCVSSGEALSLELGQRFVGRLPQAALINLYGSSEVSADATYWQVNLNSTDSAIAIGRPIANIQAYVLDRHLRVTPIGVVGELFIGGEGLARGYHNRPELTAEKFIPNPFSQQPGKRLFKTGDLIRFNNQGELEYIGRADHQVKIRGYRIELGEIEAQLLEHSNVREAVVLASQDVNGDYRLVAYLVTEHLPAPTVTELFSFLKMKLPDYMIPGAFMFLEALPLLPNGKIDKRALPAVEPSRPHLQQRFVAPHTPIEDLIASTFSLLLNIDSVGINDSFFDLGGHSLLATQLVSRLRDALGVDLPLRKVFESPTVAALALFIEDARRQADGISFDQIKPVARLPLMPVSFSQQRLWFMDRMEPRSPFYNIVSAVRVIGDLDEAALERSFQKIIQRHEALRTRFVEVDGRPMQQIDNQASFKLEVVKLEGMNREQGKRQAMQIAEQEAARGFDLSEDCLLRVKVVEVSQQERLVVIVMHHIISDGWSLGVMIREMGELYEAEKKGERAAIEELAVQYADYAVWQRKRMEGEMLDRQMLYWKEKLAGAPPSIELPTDFTRPAVETFRGAVESRAFSLELTNKLRKLGQQEGSTLFMTLLAAFNTLLYRYTQQEDIVIGSPVAGRNHIEIESLIGFFVNTLVLRTDLSGDPTFCELLRRVREMTLEAYTHQELPFEKLVEELQPERNLSRHPLFQVMFMLANAQVKQQGSSELSMNQIELDNKTSKFDLTLALRETDAGLFALIDYNTDLFDQATIKQMLFHFHALLDAIAADPSQPISSINFLSEIEINQLLFDNNHTDADYDLSHSIAELFEGVVANSPQAIAIESEGERLTYEELNRRANQLARYLMRRGAGADQVVGICVERSIEMVIGILGILKAGAAYAPFDPSYPKERLANILNQIPARLLLTQKPLVNGLDDLYAEVICIDSDWNDITQEDDHNPASRVSADNLAYIIHTSGSTGLPKGVMASHKSMLNRFYWMWERHPFESGEVCCQKTSLSFVDSVWEIFGPLLKGIKSVIIADDIVKDPTRLVETWAVNEVTRIVLVPSLLRALLDSNNDLRSKLPRLKYCVSSGEALPTDLTFRFLKAMPDCTLLNLYGSSEIAADATSFNVSTGRWHRGVPIGSPISNTRVYLLDHHLNPVPTGASGELFVGGEGLARGYLNSPDLTAERFIPSPFDKQPGARVFRTGDLARYLPDGALEYLGRIDQQVKIRGYRIEPGEIESALAKHPALRESVVLAREDAAGEKRLVAYLIADEEPAPSASEIRSYLTGLLPAYMVPSAFVVMESFPLTRSGKIDKRALPEPGPSRPELAQDFVAPRTPIEELISAIFSHLLVIDQVGVNDSFFDLGGHSLLATQLISRLRDALGVEVTLRKVFERPTVAALAQHVEEIRRGAGGVSFDEIKPVVREPRMPVSFAQQRLWFMDRMEPGSAFYNIAAAVRVRGKLDEEALESSFKKIVERHEVLRTRFVEIEGRPHQQIEAEGRLEFKVVKLKGMKEDEREEQAKKIAEQEAARGFDLSKGGLIRVKVVEISEEERLVVIVMHHIISDGWSLGVMIREMGELYEAEKKGERAAIEELAVQYADYAVWQRKRMEGEEYDRQLSYWKRQLENAPTLELPTDHPRPAVQRYFGAREIIRMPKSLSHALKLLGQRENASLYMVLMAAFNTLLYRYTGQDDILVGSPIANRTRSEIENLIGFFVNTLLIRTDLSGNPSFRELLSRVREGALEAYTHQELPFEKLVEELQPERDLSRQPLFQVMFVLQNAPAEDLRLSDLSFSYMAAETRTSKFDLTLAMKETDGGLSALMDYNTDLFEATTIKRMLSHFQALLEAVAEDPGQPLSTISFLSADEVNQLVIYNNQTEADYNFEQSIVEMFEQAAERNRQATAIEYEGAELSYEELNRRANQLARYLKKRGVGAEEVVGICVERSMEMVVGILGILKAGAAYLPLDPAYPKDRLSFMLNDAAVQVLLTQRRLSGLSFKKESDVIELDTEWSLIAQENTENIKDKAKADNLAYVIYTSGSTGDPKGTMITHRGVCNTLLWRLKTFSLNEKDRIMQTVSFAFDPSVWQIFGALLSGARLVLPRPEALKDTAYLVKFIAEREITITDFPPSLLQVLLGEQHLEECRSLRYLFSGGEALSATIVEHFYSRLNAELYNQYGPTEATIDATYWKCIAGVNDGLVPIGRPISNTQVYVLDNNLQPLPVGVAGHLHIGGDSLARGYLGQATLTAEKFIPNPFSRAEGSRLYATGDLARYRASGEIEFLGRIDGQVKLRGHRIEVAEIEARLKEHKGVSEAAVLLREDQDGSKKLVGYVTTRREYMLEQQRWAGSELQAERIEQWRAIHDQQISTSSQSHHQDPTFNIAGWSSSYTGQAIPAEEMREWVEETVERIKEMKPERVMEIGCGTGLILFRVAPGCKQYTARDFSQTSLDYVERVMKARGEEWKQVRLEKREAADFEGVEEGEYDAVIMNSVVQYFPSLEYLDEVMKQAIRAVKRGGAVYIGDVRRIELQEAFYASVERERGGVGQRVRELREKIEERKKEEKELVVSERYFEELKREESKVTEVEVEIKRGRRNNELTKYRYDVVVRVGRAEERGEAKEVDWQRDEMSVEKLRKMLKGGREERIKVKGINNKRVEKEVRLVEEVKRARGEERVEDIWERIIGEVGSGEEPETMYEVGEEEGYRVEVRWGEGANEMEVEYRRGERKWKEAEERRVVGEREGGEERRRKGNEPLKGAYRRKVSKDLREYLEERVPEVMVPSEIVVMDDLPKTANGKIDRKALPAPSAYQAKESAFFVAPQSPVEESLAVIWCELLGIDRVGVDDDFFVIGGHSLLATQLISRIRTVFDLELSLQDFFMAPSIKKMAEVIEEAIFTKTGSSKIDELLDLLEAADNESQ